MKTKPEQSVHAGAASLQTFFASLPKLIRSEITAELIYHIKLQTTIDVLTEIETLSFFIDEQQSRDPLFGEKIRSINEYVLREQILRHIKILHNSEQAYASDNADVLEAVKAETEARLRQFTIAYTTIRVNGC